MSKGITHRILNKKRHTVGYVVNGSEQTRAATIKLARRGEIEGVRVCKGPQGAYLSSTISGRSLYSLPTRVTATKARRTATAAAKTTARKTTARTTTSRKSSKK